MTTTPMPTRPGRRPDPAGLFAAPVTDASPESAPPVPVSGTGRGARGDEVAAAVLPVARVVVEVPLAHLDRAFDYLVPERLDGLVAAGSRVRVPFAGRLVGGFVLERVAASEHGGRLAWVSRAASAEPVLSAEIAGLARAVADRYAGTLADVLRLAVPPRHARVEAQPHGAGDPEPQPAVDAAVWDSYAGGDRWLAGLADGGAPRAVWWALPDPRWPAAIAAAVATTLAAGRGAVVVVPDSRDVDRVAAALTAAVGAGRFVALTADLGPAERYRRFLALSRGEVTAVVGTRAAAFAPVRDLGLVVIWDDGDDLHAEPRAPYPHARDVLVLRAARARAGALVGGFSPSVDAAALVPAGWAGRLAAPRAQVRAAAPRIQVAGGDAELARDGAARAARLTTFAWQAARTALAAGAPVLVQVPRRGYQPALACATCRRPARCTTCGGPLARSGHDAAPSCRWCGRLAVGSAAPHCRGCGDHRLRAVVVGDRRTAEELGRSFPGVPVRTSGRDAVLATVPAEPALVVATPGAEPVAADGYGTVLLLDGWALLGRPDLRAAEETLRRWCAAAALARSASRGGTVVVNADAGLPAVQALVRWDPAWFADREAAERAELGFPPAARLAGIEGPPDHVAAFLEILRASELPAGAQLLGPVPAPTGERLLVRVPRADGGRLAAALKVAQGVRSARKGEPVRVRLDSDEIG